jgi:hypothetical protein
VKASIITSSEPVVETAFEQRNRAGDYLRHPLILLMLVIWILNDHLFKDMFGNALTGKLSDFAGVAVVPLLPLAAYELSCAYLKKTPRFHRPIFIASLLATAIFMAGINLFEPWADTFRMGLGFAQWPFRSVWWLLTEGRLPSVVPVFHTADPTDLWSLLALVVPCWIVLKTQSPNSKP